MSHHLLPTVPIPLASGCRMGAYTLVACRAEDLDGFVYDAVETDTGRPVTVREGCPVGLVERVGEAVMPLPGAEAEFREWLDRWTRLTGHWQQVTRSAALAHLGHLALTPIEACGQARGTAWVCLPPLAGRSLRQVVEAGPGWPDRAVVDAGLRACCEAVEPLHRLGEVHGNLTPERVIVLDDGAWCLPLPDSDPARQPLSPWLAPEQTEVGRASGLLTGPWTDVHALAALAHWLLTGSAPPSLSRRRAEAPDCWAELERAEADPLRRRALRSALAPDPARRLGNVAALRMALGWTERPTPPAPAPKPPPVLPPVPGPSAPRRDRFSPVALVGMGVSLALVSGVLWLNREVPPPLPSPPPPPPQSAVTSTPLAEPARAAAAAPVRPAPASRVVAPAATVRGESPPARPASMAAVRPPAPPVPVVRQKNRAQPSEDCVEWLRRRSLEPAGDGRVVPDPACR